MKRMLALACIGALMLALPACSSGNDSSSQNDGPSLTPPGSASSSGAFSEQLDTSGSGGGSDTQPGPADSTGSSSSQHGEAKTVTLYIGMDGQFKEYPLETEEAVTPTELVKAISDLTGWNLDLTDEVASGKGGMTVSFAETCALFVGPPDPQKDEFHVFDAGQLDKMILDSIQKTLQNWAVVPGLGDPDSVDIYFCGPDGGDLVLENLGVTITATEPYQGFPDGNAIS